MDYDEFDELQAQMVMLITISEKFKDLYFLHGDPLFKELSEKSLVAKDYLKEKLKKTIEVTF